MDWKTLGTDGRLRRLRQRRLYIAKRVVQRGVVGDAEIGEKSLKFLLEKADVIHILKLGQELLPDDAKGKPALPVSRNQRCCPDRALSSLIKSCDDR